MSKKLTTEEFIEKANLVHDNKYDYSKVEYINSHIKINIICPNHGIFEQMPYSHLNNNGCKKCGYEKNSRKGKLTFNIFLKKAKKIHGNKYDYSKVKYKNNHTKIKIICSIHGIFFQTPHNHLSGNGCKKCNLGAKKLTTEEFIEKANLVHDNKYDYSLVNYKHNKQKIKIICSIHGIFEQKPTYHLRGSGCKKCNESKGEKAIREFLIKENIVFEEQKTFNDCKNIKLLPFDFYLPKYNLLIEYDGEQHFEEITFFGGSDGFFKRQKNDLVKNNYTKKNNIKLIRIPYTEFNNIEKTIKKATS